MSLQFSTIDTQSRFGLTIHHKLVRQAGGSDKLLILLPGRGYTVDHPLLYTLRKSALQSGWDVLSVQYGFALADRDLDVESISSLQEDVDAATTPVLSGGYNEVCIAGKSLGTPLAAELAKRLTGRRVSLILFTPIGGATQGLGGLRTLAVGGTADPLYVPEMAADEPAIQWLVIEGVNHSLEHKDEWRASLDVLARVIGACEAFLSS
jgi:hypothetical protein